MKKSKALSSTLSRVLVIPDCHIPYHNRRAWNLFLTIARDFQPSLIIILGDFIDCYCISDYSKDPRRIAQLDQELEEAHRCLDQLDTLGASDKYFIAGNHCDRLERYLKQRAPELFLTVKVEKLLKLKERGWRYIPYKTDVKIGKIYFTHDIGSTAGRASVHRTLDAYQHSAVIGHTHRMQYVVEGNAAGDTILSAQFGWLGDLNQIDYLHTLRARKDWALGFGLGYLRDNGFMYLSPIPLVEYSAVVNGKLYVG